MEMAGGALSTIAATASTLWLAARDDARRATSIAIEDVHQGILRPGGATKMPVAC